MKEGRERALIFQWGAGQVWRGRLWLYVGGSLLAHLLVFYLIRVVDPEVERWTPQTIEIALLPGGNEVVGALLRELDDRTFHLYPVSEVALRDRDPGREGMAFRPSFANYQIGLRPLLTREERRELIRPAMDLETELVGLPPRPRGGESEPGVPEASRTAYLNFGPELVWRKFEVDRERLAAWFRTGQPLYFRVYAGVSPRGEVQVMSVAEELEGKITAEELEMVRQSLRFAPAENWAWDWIEIQR